MAAAGGKLAAAGFIPPSTPLRALCAVAHTKAMRMGTPSPKPMPRPNPRLLLLLLLDEEAAAAAAEDEEGEGLDATVRVGVGVRVAEGVGEATGSTTVAATGITALMRDSVESKPSELDTPDCCTAKVKEPSESLLLTRVSMLDCSSREVSSLRPVEEVVVYV